MSEQDQDLGPSDAELISRVRAGDVASYGTLFARHVDAANRLARQLTPGSDADDLVSEAFVKVLNVLLGGGGPDIAFRAYLLTAVRRLHIDKIRSTNRATPTDDLTPYDPGVPFHDSTVAGFEGGAAARAFGSLPERWQLVLWHLEVEGQKPADIAPLLGMSANSVSALAYRAREGLREAFLNMHMNDLVEEDCRWTHDHLGGYVRNGLSKRDAAKVDEHLKGCVKCTAIYLELTEVNSGLALLIGPLVLGAATAGYLGTTTAGAGAVSAAGGGVLLFFGRAKDFVLANSQAAIGVGLAAAVATAVAAGLVVNHDNNAKFATSEANVGITQPTQTASGDGAPAVIPPTTASVTPTTTPTPTPTATTTPSTSTTTPPSILPTTLPIIGPIVLPPTASSTPTPTKTPTHKPTKTPTKSPTTPPPPPPTSSSPTPTPTPTPPAEPTADIAVSASSSNTAVVNAVTARVSGIPSGQTVILRVHATGGITFGTVSSACVSAGAGSLTCTVRPGTGALQFGLVNLISTATITFTADVPNGYTDPDTGNNSASVSAKSILD